MKRQTSINNKSHLTWNRFSTCFICNEKKVIPTMFEFVLSFTPKCFPMVILSIHQAEVWYFSHLIRFPFRLMHRHRSSNAITTLLDTTWDFVSRLSSSRNLLSASIFMIFRFVRNVRQFDVDEKSQNVSFGFPFRLSTFCRNVFRARANEREVKIE